MRVGVVPADEVHRRDAARQVLARDAHRTVGLGAHGVDHRVVALCQFVGRDVSADRDTLPKNRNRGSSAVFSNVRLTDLILGWSGATPERTRPHGVGSISSMSIRMSRPLGDGGVGGAQSDAAGEEPGWPAPTIAIWKGRILGMVAAGKPRSCQGRW